MKPLLLVGLVCLMGCHDPNGLPEIPDATIRITPFPVYATWWKQVDSCSGITTSMSDVSFYAVVTDYSGVLEIDGLHRWAGLYRDDSHSITIATPWQLDPMVVRHEMLHAHLPDGGVKHPPLYFRERCSALVSH